MRKVHRFIGLVAVLALVVSVPVMGQVLKGSISGTVVDPQGAVIANAQVKATNVETNVVTTTTTDSSGLFRLNLLPAGTYNVSITAQGFKTAEIKGRLLSPGEDEGLGSIHMAVGGSSETLEVTGSAPLVETSQAQVTNTFSGVTLNTFAGIEENEGLDRLALFTPGVTSSRNNNFSNTNGASIASNGLRGRNNDQEIDGQNNNDNSVGGPGLFLSDTSFVQQYVIVTNNFGPEYGRNSGSVVNIITKQGTNNWHGALFGTEGNSFLNALSNTQRNTNKNGTNTGLPGTVTCTDPTKPICNPITGPPRSNDEFGGGAIGGPILKNKMFIFGGFDQEIATGSSIYTTTSTSPTPLGLSQLGACGVNATALSVLQNFGPYAFSVGNPSPRNLATVAVGSCAAIQVGGVTRVVSTPSHFFNWVLRNDIQLSKDTITTRYLFNRNNFFNLNDFGAVGWIFNEPALSQAMLLSETHNFSSHMVNEVRVSFSRLGVEFGGGLNSFEPVAGQLPTALANIAFQDTTASIGPATNLPQSRLVNTWQGQDNWNYILGKHTIKGGVNWTYQRSPNIFLPNINGAYRFSSLNSFLTTDQPNRIIVGNGNPNLDFREYDTFLYAGDDWKMSQNLTLNLGLTWTYYGSPENLFSQLTKTREANTNITPGCVSSATCAFWLQSLPQSVTTNPEIPAVKSSFGPSVGFAYSPQWGGFLMGHGKTVFRGGYRLLYDPPFYNIFVNISSSAPMTFLQTLTGSSVTGLLLPAVPTGPNVRASLQSVLTPNKFDPRTFNETNVSNNFGPDKVHAWSLGLERELTKNAALEIRYAGNHAVNLFQTVDANPFLGTTANPGLLQKYPQFLPPGTPSSACAATQQSGTGAGTDVGRASCGLGVGRFRTNGAFSDYNSLQVQFRANNLFKQLTMQTGYTWSKTLDNVSEIFGTNNAGNTNFAAQNPFQTGDAERSHSGLDFPHVWTVLFTEQLPFFKEQHGAVGHLLGGWAISANYILASGQPYTPSQAFFEAVNSDLIAGAGDFYDSAFVGAFLNFDSARPFFGNPNAPSNTVGIYAGDFCRGVLGVNPTGSPTSSTRVACNTLLVNPNTLLSLNSMNNGSALLGTAGNGGRFNAGAALTMGQCGSSCAAQVQTITANDVRFIINGQIAQSVFGTPFGNVPRNVQRDAISNIANASIFKNIKVGERVNFEVHLTALNALNHFNFNTISPTLENAGRGYNAFGADFANPTVSGNTNGRTVIIGGRVTF